MKPLKERTIRSFFAASVVTSFFTFFMLGAGVRSVDAVFVISMLLLSVFIATLHVVVFKGLDVFISSDTKILGKKGDKK